MFVVLLKFSAAKDKAPQFMDKHMQWIKKGLDDGIFLMVGSLQPKAGGALICHNATRAEIENRVNMDPFVVEGVVKPEILEITPSKADERLQFLLDG